MKISCQFDREYQKFLSLIPRSLDPSKKQNPKHFTRIRKLPLPKLLVFLLHMVGAGRTEGVDIEAGRFFKNARRSGLWPEAQAIHRSALTKARSKVSWTLFRDIQRDAIDLARELWPTRPEDLWHGMSVLAIDGSKYTLPATDELRREFDPDSGLENPGKGHYPQCLVSTLYDAMRRLPISRTVMPANTSEREQAVELLPDAPLDSVVLFDRGYPSFELLQYLDREFAGRFLVRCPATGTFSAVSRFVKSGKAEDVISIQPPLVFENNLNPEDRKRLRPLVVRCIRMQSEDGTISVLLTDLIEADVYPREEILALYYLRWRVEEGYRDEKIVLDVEKFHGRSPNSVRQELFAAMIVTVIARTMAALTEQAHEMGNVRCQNKNAVMTLACEAAVLTPEDSVAALALFHEMLEEMARVKYYPPKGTRPPQPRVAKSAPNKWRRKRRQAVSH